MKYQSIATWPLSEDNCVEKSTDTHDTHEQAAAVCRMLRRDGMGGCRKVFPLTTMVRPVYGDEVVNA